MMIDKKISLIFDIDTNQVKIETAESSVGVVCVHIQCVVQPNLDINKMMAFFYRRLLSISIWYISICTFSHNLRAIWRMCFRKSESSQPKFEVGKRMNKVKRGKKGVKWSKGKRRKKIYDMWIIHGIDSYWDGIMYMLGEFNAISVYVPKITI